MAKEKDEGAPLAKDFVAVRVNVTSSQLDEVLTALGISKTHRAQFAAGSVFIMQKRTPAAKKKRTTKKK
jgi:hypothetical protein